MKLLKYIFLLAILNVLVYGSNNNPTKEEISKLYVATFNRAPDNAGLEYWLNESGLKLTEIAQSFFVQEETREKYPEGTTNRSFVRSVYLNLFNREPDLAGLDYWESELDTGTLSKNVFIQAIIDGATDTELGLDKTILNNKNEIGLYFANAGLDDKELAIEAMAEINSDYSSVIFIKKEIDSFILLPQSEPYYKYAWHLNSKDSVLNDIGYSINENADINIESAWKITKGAGVKIAIIDDGAHLNHEDLKENIVSTYYADEDNTDADYIVTEDFISSHGNTCAGFAASPTNGKGLVGVAPESDLVIIKLEGNDDISTIRAFNHAQDTGAKVISCSWGSNQVSEVLVEKLKELYHEGITVLFASGNDTMDLDGAGLNDESEVEWVIGVGASSEANDVTTYSNYGNNIDILAPGGDSILSVGLLGLDNMGAVGYDNQLGLVNSNYSFTDGTSFSCPISAGVVALMYSVNPDIKPNEVRDILTSTADKIGATTYNQDGFDSQKLRAYGKINATNAVDEALRIKK